MLKIKEWAKLFRIEHGIMLSFATFIALKILSNTSKIDENKLIFALLVPLFIELGAFALNDFFDIETDKKNKRYDRPLVKGSI